MKILINLVAVWKKQPPKGELDLPGLERHLLHIFTGCFTALVLSVWMPFPVAILCSVTAFILLELASVIIWGETIRNAAADIVQYSFQLVLLNFLMIHSWETIIWFAVWLIVYYILLPKVTILTVEEK